MITVRVDGQPVAGNISDIRMMTDLVEYVKATIDPDTIITSLSINGSSLSDADWRVPLSVQGTSVLEVTTGTKEAYVSDRLSASSDLLSHIVEEFMQARGSFQAGNAAQGNSTLSRAVNDFRAFVEWYTAVLEVVPASFGEQRGIFQNDVAELTKVFDRVLQQQLYQSWWAIGQTIETKLEPQLAKLQGLCTAMAQQ